MKLTRLFPLGILVVGLFLLSACGFQLSGHTPLLPNLKELYLDTPQPYAIFAVELRQTLNSMGVTVTESPMGVTTLKIIDTRLNSTTTSLGSVGQTTIYNVNYSVTFQLLSLRGEIITPTRTLTASRSFSITASQVDADSNSFVELEEAMRQSIISQLVSTINSPATEAQFLKIKNTRLKSKKTYANTP
jgi:outer membrane lipopolysaccharide assembly protein LptE/RlpB